MDHKKNTKKNKKVNFDDNFLEEIIEVEENERIAQEVNDLKLDLERTFKSNEQNLNSEKEKKIELVNNALEWTESEELELLKAIKQYGPLDLNNLIKTLPSKRRESIHLQMKLSAIRSRAAFRNAQKNVKKMNKPPSNNLYETKEGVPIQEWWKILEEYNLIKGNADIQTQRSFTDALHYISLYEKISPPAECGGVDLRELYKYLYNACMGLPCKIIDKCSYDFLFHTMRMLNQEMKKSNTIEKYLSSLHSVGSSVKQEVTDEWDIANIFQEPIMNPFDFPINFLNRDALDNENN